MTNYIVYAVLLSVFLTLTGCYQKESDSSSVRLKRLNGGEFEVEIPIHIEWRGNIHQLDASKCSFEESVWLYINAHDKIVSYENLVLTNEKGKLTFPWRQSNLRGFVRLSRDSLTIQLILPVYKDTDTLVDGWSPWDHNGNYAIKHIN